MAKTTEQLLNDIHSTLTDIQTDLSVGSGSSGGGVKYYDDNGNFRDKKKTKEEAIAIAKNNIAAKRAAMLEEISLQREKIRNTKELNKKEKELLRKELDEKAQRIKFGKSVNEIKKLQVDAIKQKSDKLVETINKVNQGLQVVIDAGLAYHRNTLQQTRNAFDKQIKLMQAELQMSNVVASNLVNTISSSLSQTATQASRSIAKGAMDEAHARIDMTKSISMAEQQFLIAEEEREKTAIEAQMSTVQTGLGVVSGILFALAPLTGGISAVVAGVALGAAALSAAAGAAKESYSKFKEFDIEKYKAANEMYDKMYETSVAQPMNKMRKIVEGITDTANGIVDFGRENESIYKKTGLTMGFSGEGFTKYMQNMQSKLSETFDITAEQASQMLSSYADTSGRMLLFTSDNFNQMEAVARSFGTTSSEIASIMGEMNIFNVSIEDGTNMLDEMHDTLSKMGLTTSKFSKELANNLKLAQKYNFKGGVENMMKLTAWAEKTRFNLQNATTFAEKMMSNNITEVLETTARLQVLGGNAGLYADPMAMMWEAGNDVGSFAKRQSAMFGDISGTFDASTGTTTFSEFEFRKARAIAEAMGISYEDILNQARESNKMARVNNVLAGYNLEEEDKIGIGKRAQWDNKNKQWFVNTLNGPMTVQQIAKLSQQERERILLPDNEQDAILDTAKNTRALVEIETATLNMTKAMALNSLWGKVKSSSQKLTQKQKEFNLNSHIWKLMSDSIEGQTDGSIRQMTELMNEAAQNPDLVVSYYDYVENELGKQTVLQQTEIALLGMMAKKDGVESISGALHLLSKQMTDADLSDEERKNLENSYAPILSQIGLNDGYGYTNGGLITSASVTPINDGTGRLVKTHPNDQFLAAKSGGPIDKLFDIVSNIINNDKSGNNKGVLNIELSGNINLQDGNNKVNLVEIIKKDPVTAREFTRLIIKNMDSSNNGKVSQQYYI